MFEMYKVNDIENIIKRIRDANGGIHMYFARLVES